MTVPLSAQAKTFSQKLFDQTFYLNSNPDVLTAVSQGLTTAFGHFSTFGHWEDRPLLPFFNTQAYLLANPDVANATTAPGWVSAWNHFVLFGILEGRSPNGTTGFTGLFDNAKYLAQNADVNTAVSGGAFRNGFEHYLLFGAKEGRAAFDKGGNAIDLLSSVTPGKTFTLTAGNDTVIGGDGNDTINAPTGTLQAADVINGGFGKNTLNVTGSGTATTDANLVNVQTVNWTPDDAANARTLNLTGQTEKFTINVAAYGTSGNAATLTLGAGDDTIILANASNFKTNEDVINGGGGTNTLRVDAGNLIATNNNDLVNISSITLNGAGQTLTLTNQTENFTITGSSGNDSITGGEGNDSITGGAGNDTIVGSAGNDTLLGGDGDDEFRFATGVLTATTVINGGAGTNTLKVTGTGTATTDANLVDVQTVNWTPDDASNPRTLNLTGQTENFTIKVAAYGGAGNAATLTLGAGDDTIILADATNFSADVINGGGGTNTLRVDAGNLSAPNDVDLVNIASITLNGSGQALTLTSQTENFTITGSSGNDTITGGAGNDSITGGAGDDTINGGAGNDTINGGAGDDTINGGAGNDTIDGGAGNDTIIGGLGVDVMAGGTGDDVFLYTATGETGTISGIAFSAAVPANGQVLNVSGADVITDFSNGDKINVGGSYTANAIVKNAGTVGAATAGEVILLQGTYNASTGQFTVDTGGNDSLFIYDDNGTAAGGNWAGIVLVGYIDTGAADTLTAGGVFTATA